jgi:menaquinone-dependent protoporphyrinogen oxidase
MDKVLIAFATTHGSTQEVAEFVAKTLREQGSEVDLQAAKNVRSLEEYSVIVLGIPLYMFRLHGDAVRFLKKNHKAFIAGLPLAIFAGGPFGDSKPEDWQKVRDNLNQELGKYNGLRPFAVEVVGGRFDPTHLRFPWNLIPALKQMPSSDLRDWEAIRSWAGSLTEKVQAISPK